MGSHSARRIGANPVAAGLDLGPLAPLIGTWEGGQGHDDLYVYARGQEHARFREHATFAQQDRPITARSRCAGLNID